MRKDSESGYVLVTVAASLFVLVGFTALAVDLGTALSSRTQLQRGADAAALAGAYTFTVPTATEAMATETVALAKWDGKQEVIVVRQP